MKPPRLSDRCARCSVEYMHHKMGRCPHGLTAGAHFLPRPEEDGLEPALSCVEYGPCPTCGASGGQACSVPDPEDPRLGIELSTRVHSARAEGL